MAALAAAEVEEELGFRLLVGLAYRLPLQFRECQPAGGGCSRLSQVPRLCFVQPRPGMAVSLSRILFWSAGGDGECHQSQQSICRKQQCGFPGVWDLQRVRGPGTYRAHTADRQQIVGVACASMQRQIFSYKSRDEPMVRRGGKLQSRDWPFTMITINSDRLWSRLETLSRFTDAAKPWTRRAC